MLRIGLVGAGPWARSLHAKGLAASPDVTFAGVWARRQEAAGALVAEHGGRAYPTVDALIEDVDAVAFAVPPDVQAEHGTRAAKAGRHLLLEKPIAADVASAQRLADAVHTAGVRTGVFFTAEYTAEAREFLAAATAASWHGARAAWVSGALLSGEFVDSAWRHERGALWDVGPHAVELLDAALGPVTEVRAAARGQVDLVQLVLEHESGAVSQATLSLRVPAEPPLAELTLLGDGGALSFSLRGLAALDAYGVLVDELAGQVRGDEVRPACDVDRGLHVQRILARADELIR
ncbi:MAG: Gfo/Idh/MocA family oxidoreductase [Streptosporangiales bacterium]|nr:Gfo/Idh/MocA family oxidoreductase [Streptosporangiales bacterium]MBO0892067.1 Gfo/Idh/MocA family oxidoreductase [Acidothermales bacterium]